MADPRKTYDWQEDDAAWERLRLDVDTALRANDMPLTRRRIGQMLAYAQAHFQPGDPRLAASLTCQARQLQTRQATLSARLFEDAIAHWDQAPTWLTCQPSRRRLARSSSFHVRLESKHPGAYQERRREGLSSSLASGRALTAALRRGSGRVASCGLKEANAEPAAEPADGTEKKIDTAVDLLRLLESDGDRFDRTATD